MEERLKNYLKEMERLLGELEQGTDAAGCAGGEVPNGGEGPRQGGRQDGRSARLLQKDEGPNGGAGPQQDPESGRRERLQKEKAELLTQIGFFQQERLVHLIVTALFALLAMIVFVVAVTAFSPWSGLLLLLFLVLLIPYIRHYYILENGVQRLYKYYDRLAAMQSREEAAASRGR